MNWIFRGRTGLGALLLAVTIVGCNDGDSTALLAPDANEAAVESNNVTYDQVEFLGNPLVSEVTIVKANHDGYNETMPYTSGVYRPQTGSLHQELSDARRGSPARSGASSIPTCSSSIRPRARRHPGG
ncbi:MAG: hypothetical protein IPK33_24060 [Gemmatimonadetes bacterium]|nr:hypothetical protein [Gemmatimonadota bacterium]